MNILITESKDYSKKALEIYNSLNSKVCFWSDFKSGEKNKVLEKTSVLVIRLGNKIDKTWIDKMPNLKIIATPTTGLNHIDSDYAKSKNIKIISLRGQASFLKNITSTAELAFGLIISLARNINSAFESVKKDGKWDRMSFRGNQLSGKIIGIIGYGRLGKIMAKYAKAFSMGVLIYDPYIKNKNNSFITLDKLFKESDIVSLHALLLDSNKEFIKIGHFEKMKSTAYFINTARAELIEKNALYKALKNKSIAGAAIDVMWNEDGNGEHLNNDPLWDYVKNNNNLIIVPHIGGATFEAMHITEDFIAKEVEKCIKSGKLK